MRTLTAPAQALLDRVIAGERLPMVQLLVMELDSPIYLTTAGVPLVWGGHTWQPTGLRIQPIEHLSGADIDQLQFVLPGVSDDDLALALSTPVEGKTVRVYDALVDPASGAVADAVEGWVGALGLPSFEDGQEAAVSWTAEHRAIQAMRPKPVRYSNDAQQRLYPGDTSLDFDPATDAAALAWPAASFFKQP
jgi:hypothetical protein